MRALLSLVVVMAFGCSSGSSVADTRPPVFVWVDATGAVVGPYSGPQASFIDDQGFMWQLNSVTGKVDAPHEGAGASLFFESADCSGPAFMAAAIRPLEVRGVFKRAGLWAVKADAVIVDKTIASDFSGSCSPRSTSVLAVVAEDALVAAPAKPSLAFAGPLHVARR